jgi:hypothetical protein
MFVTKMKTVLAVVLVVGLALGGGGLSVGRFLNSMAEARQPGTGAREGAAQTDSKEKRPSVVKTVQIRVGGPSGMRAALVPESMDGIVLVEGPGMLTLEQGKHSRLKLSGITNRLGFEFFPTVEIPKLDATAVAFVTRSAIPLDFTDKDFDIVDKGGVTAKIVFLEKGRPTTLVSHDGTLGSMIEEARRRGVILAVVRLANILRVTEPGRKGQEVLLEIEIGDARKPPERAPQVELLEGEVETVQRKLRDEIASLQQRVKDTLTLMVRELRTAQTENEALRQRAEKAELELKALQSSLANKELELTRLNQELRRAKDKK